MDIIDLLASDNYIIVNKDMIKEYGLDFAVMIGELASEFRYYRLEDKLEDGMFYSTIENVQNNVGLSGYQQKVVLNKMEKIGILKVHRKGLPAKRYIEFDLNIFENKFLKNLRTRTQKINKLDIEKFDINNNNIKNNNKNNKNIEEAKYFNDDEVNELFIEFLNQRKKLKAVNSDLAINKLISKIKGLPKQVQIETINESIINSWKGLFPRYKAKENVPEWFDANIEDEQPSDEDLEEMKKFIGGM